MKNAYLTIDDAPSADFAAKVAFLKANSIPAIIFCIGQQIAGNEAALVHAIQDGFVLGNHSFSHTRFSLLAPQQIEAEISKTDVLLDGLYARAGVKRPLKLFRFPYGDNGGNQASQAQEILQHYGYESLTFAGVTHHFYRQHLQKGLLDIPWTYNVMEYKFASLDDLEKRLAAREWPLGTEMTEDGDYLDAPSPDIVLVHDHAKTSFMFEAIIRALQRHGLTFVAPRLQVKKP